METFHQLLPGSARENCRFTGRPELYFRCFPSWSDKVKFYERLITVFIYEVGKFSRPAGVRETNELCESV